jgi:hypothetical protein
LIKNKSLNEFTFDAIDILSLEDFYWYMPAISWRGSVSYNSFEDKRYVEALAGVGPSFSSKLGQFYSLFTIVTQAFDESTIVLPGLNIGMKYSFNNKFRLVAESFYSKKEDVEFKKTEAKLIYRVNQYEISPSYNFINKDEQFLLEASVYY